LKNKNSIPLSKNGIRGKRIKEICIFVKTLDMRAFKFNTRISEDGTIHLPYAPLLFNREVELIVVPKNERKSVKKAGRAFVAKWAGFLSSNDTDSSKFEYLSEKYK
jgi:hypothetical protein